MNRNSSLLFYCLLIYCFNYVNCQNDASKTCIFSGTCGIDQNTGRPIPCEQNTSPIKLNDSTAIDTLNHFCPNLAGGPVCCDTEQLDAMKSNFLAVLSFKDCAPCVDNFFQIFCQSTCSPIQNQFVEVLERLPADDDKTKFKIKKIAYLMNLTDADLIYSSCSLTYSSVLGTTLIGLFGSAKHGTQMMYDIGHSSESPFVIDFQFKDDNRTFHLVEDKGKIKEENISDSKLEAIKFDLLDCDEMTAINATCRCSQCAKLTCPIIPGINEPENCMIFDLFSCSSLSIFIVYSLLLSLSVVFFVRYMRQRNTPDEKENEILEEDKSSSNDGIGSKMEELFSKFFESWTLICVRYPYMVIVVGLLLITLLSLGLLNFTVISDPVELWSSPNSLTRQQREFYNNKFNPFFRVQQIIIRNTDDERYPNSTYSNLFDYDFMLNSLRLQNQITSLSVEYENETITLNDICYDPMNNGNCVIQSPFTWFQENEANFKNTSYLNKIDNCLDSFFSDKSCFGSYGGPAFPYVALGGFDGQNYKNATSLIITIMINNHVEEKDNLKAMMWEKKYLDFMNNYTKNLTGFENVKISYYSERSVGDELERQSLSDVGTIAISYIIMFLYVSIALGQIISEHKLFIDSKVGLAIVGVLIVLASVSSSVGFLSLCGVKATLIIVEVIPFLVLAVGVDNIFIIVQTLNRERSHDDSIEEKMAKVMSKVGPSLLLAFLSEVSCFFLGAMSSMPCIRIFALNAALALVFDFLLQMTVFLAFLSLDAKRQKEARYDILVCIKSKKNHSNENLNENQSVLFNFFNNIYAPFLMKDIVRFVVLVIFSLSLCIAFIVVKDIDVGLDQELAMPEDSYVNSYFLDQKSVLRVGPPMFFVMKNPIDLANLENRKLIAGYSDTSLVSLIKAKSMQNNSYLATGANSWVDAYDNWIESDDCFQVFKSNNSFCSSTVKNRGNLCIRNESLFDDSNKFKKVLKPEYYYEYFDDFLNDVPSFFCAYGGRALYKDAVKLIERKPGQKTIDSSYFMAYHSVLQSSSDFVNAFEDAKLTSKYIEDMVNKNVTSGRKIEIFPYSIFYVFYDQFLTMWNDAILSLTLSLLAILLVTFVMLGFDLRNSMIALFTLISILFNILSVMYWWNISLNAVSLVNLVMSIGISVEFCSHILHHYCTNSRISSKSRAQSALSKMGSSVFSGIALTKFVGIVVLANSKSQIFQIFYFRMYLAIVLVGSTHGLILLPVLLSLFGGRAKLNTESSTNTD